MDIVSFYTGEGAYKDFADKLRRSCEKFGITPHIEQLPTTGDWVKNNSLKPQFIQRQLLALKRPVLWCDADCEVIERPERLEKPAADFAAFNWAAEREGDEADQNEKVLRSAGGVLWFNYTPPAIQLLYQWVTWSIKEPTIPDDRLLDMLWVRWRGPKIRTLWLPRTYNRMDLKWPNVKPVINHVYRDGAIFTGAQTLDRDPWLGQLPDTPLGMPPRP